jgi:plastocyanin
MKKLSVFKSMFLLVVAVLLVIVSFLNSCTKKSDMPGANEVFIQGNAFSPGTITVKANSTVTWNNKDGVAHTVTSDTPGLFESGSISSSGGYGGGGTWSHSFTTAGSFPYHCSIHSSMKGTVVVQ